MSSVYVFTPELLNSIRTTEEDALKIRENGKRVTYSDQYGTTTALLWEGKIFIESQEVILEKRQEKDLC
ncbi:hypothetical protein MW324_001090 [Vibrio parahaemolyticus]|nr:hypothetical protein [Vibrio parahaemolyticus]